MKSKKMRIKFLIILMAVSTSISWATSDPERSDRPTDPKALGRLLLERIERVQNECDTIEQMIGDGGLYKGLASKPVQKALDTFSGATEEPEAGFLKALNSCLSDFHMTAVDKDRDTLERLWTNKKEHLNALERFLTEQGIDIESLKEEREAEKIAGAAVALEALPTKADVFGGDFRSRPELGKYLHYYLSLETLGEFLDTQASLPIAYGAEFIADDERFPAIFGAGGKEYKKDARYIWCNLMEIVMNRFHGGVNPNDDSFNPYAAKLKYNDVWAINAHLTGNTRSKKTQDAYEHFKSSGIEKAAVRALRGLGLRK